MSRKFFRNSQRKSNKSKNKRLSPLASLLATGLGSAGLAVAQSSTVPDLLHGPAAVQRLVGR